MLRWATVLSMLALMSGCEASSTGAIRQQEDERESIVVYTSSPEHVPVDVPDKEFKAFIRQRATHVSDEEFNAFMRELGVLQFRFTSNSQVERLILASWEPEDGAQDPGMRDYLRWCKPLDRCISLPGDGHSFGPEAKRAVALNIALSSIWPGVVEAVQGIMDIRHFEVMVVSTLVVYLGLLAAPEPVTKFVAAKLTYILLGYLTVNTLWSLVDGWTDLTRDLRAARSFDEVYAAGERFGKRMGAQVAHVLVMLVTWRLGGKIDGAMPETMLPGAPTASRMLAAEGGVGFSAADAVRSVTLGEGRVAVAFSSGTEIATERDSARQQKKTAQKEVRPQQRQSRNGQRVPIVAQTGQQDEDDCKWHHIATNKNEDSDVRGGPWTPRFQPIFARAGMSLDDPANLVCVLGHKGPHPREYHQEVLDRLQTATMECRGKQACRSALTNVLKELGDEIATPDTRLNQLVTTGASH